MDLAQKAAAAAKLANMARGGDRKSDQTAISRFDLTSMEEAAKKFDVPLRSAQAARRIRQEAPERVAELKAGGEPDKTYNLQ